MNSFKQPKYSFLGLLETPSDVENNLKRGPRDSSTPSCTTRNSNTGEKNPGRNVLTTPRFTRPNGRPLRTPRSTSSGPFHTPRGPNAITTPFTASSAISNDNESSTIAALVEGRGHARGEIGITSFDLKQPVLTLSQFSDSQTYAKTITKLQNLNPLEILLPNTMCELTPKNKLFDRISEHFPNLTVSSIQRRYFNENKGLYMIKHLCAEEYKAIELQISSKYYCLATTSALIKCVEFYQNIVIAPKSLKIVFKGSERATMIDSATIKGLELVQNLSDPNSQQTLFGVLNHTKTAGGTRFLRSNILQPVNDEETIRQRQEVVKELSGKEDIFYNLQSVISKFPDIGHVVSACIQLPKQETYRTSETKLMSVIILKHILQCVDSLRESLSYCENSLFKVYCKALENPKYKIILDEINEIISSETHYSKGLLQQKTQKCMAIKQGVNGLLDVARRTYTELLEDYKLVILQRAEDFKLALRPAYSSLRGHHIQLPSVAADGSEIDARHGLPSVFIKVSKFKTTLSCTTLEVLKLNERIKHSLNEIFNMANIVVSKLLVTIRDHIGCLYELSDIVSMTDMLLSFSHSATLYSYVIPEFTDTLAIKQGLHPILQTTGNENFVPNDIYASDHSNFIIITGPNMGGKSTYLRQVALLQIMAQIGSFVPAMFASFRIADQIFSRIGSDDDMESNSSTFTLEMKESNYILQNLTESSLVIIDELGRGTSAEEGVGICWAIAEKLLASKAFTFFVTHFLQLSDLCNNHPNVASYFFEVQRVFNSDAKCENCTFTHVLTRGTTPDTHYGLKLAELSSLPASVVQDAKTIASSVERTKLKNKVQDASVMKQHACFNLATKLIQVAKNSKMDEETLRAYLKNLKRQYLSEMEKAGKVTSSGAESSSE